MEKRKTIITHSADETMNVGEEIAASLGPGDIVSLSGPIGAGKTTFTQGIARGLGIKRRVISPTFVLVREYKGERDGKEFTLYHLDLYRVNGKADIRNLGISEILEDKDGIVIIEWADRDESLRQTIDVRFGINGISRKITIAES